VPYNLLWESAFVGEVAFTLRKKFSFKRAGAIDSLDTVRHPRSHVGY